MSDVMSKAGIRPTGNALSLPNILTYGRLLAVPLVAGLIMWGGDAARWIALALFIAAAVTDFFDGYLARLWQQQSALGRMLDPIADKVLVAAVLLVLAAIGISLHMTVLMVQRRVMFWSTPGVDRLGQ